MPKPKTRANGTGTAFKRGRTWTAEVVVGYKPDKNGIMRPIRRTKGGFRTKTDALNAIPDLKTSGLSRKQNSIVTLDMLWKEYKSASYPNMSKKRQICYNTARKKIEDIAYTDIRLLSVADLQKIINAKAQTYASAKDVKILLSQLYKRAVAEQYITVNYAPYIELPKQHSKETEAFTQDEIATLWKEWDKSRDLIVGCMLFMIYTGMMPGELCSVTKDMIDMESQTINGAGLKTDIRRNSPIVLPDIILPLVQEFCDNATGERILPISYAVLWKRFYSTVKRLGLHDGLRPYSCRHTTATILAKGDAPIFAMKSMMRHASISTTQRYVHINTEDVIQAANNVVSTPSLSPTNAKNRKQKP